MVYVLMAVLAVQLATAELAETQRVTLARAR